AVWLTPGSDWRRDYDGWPALAKLEYVDRLMADVRERVPPAPSPGDDDLPVESMHYTVAEHYADDAETVPIDDRRLFDADLRRIFMAGTDAPAAEQAMWFIHRHYREVVGRI